MKKLMMAVAVLALAGCGEKKETKAAGPQPTPAVVISAENRPYAELSTNEVVVRVNGAELTKGEVERQIAFRLSMAKMRPGKKLDDAASSRLASEMRRTCDKQFILQELMKGYALTNGVNVTEEDRQKMRESIVKAYTRGGKYGKIVKALSLADRSVLAEGVDREIWVQKGREKLAADNKTPVTAEEVTKRRDYFTKYNENAKAALAKTWVDATNVWKKATGGYPFEKLIEMYADGKVEHVLSEDDWGDIKASDYRDDPGLYRVLTTTPEGCIPPPFEGDNGVLVVKMLKVTPADATNGKSEPLYRLAKIHFELPEVWEVETDDELRADLEKIHRREALSKGMQALVDASRIEYPCGTNLFPRAAAKRRPLLPAEVLRRLPKGVKISQ